MNVIQELRQRSLITGKVTLKRLSGGYINTVYRVNSKAQDYVIKIYHELAQKANIRASKERVAYEAHALNIIEKLVKESPTPHVIFNNKKIICMTAAPRNATNYNDDLLKGKINLLVPKLLAKFSAELHSSTYHNAALKKEFFHNPGYFDLRYKPSLETPAQKNPKIRQALQQVYKRNFINRICLIHADTTPKNVLVSGDEITVLDFEMAIYGDPAHDVGITLAHFILPGFKHKKKIKIYIQCARIFYSTYISEVTFPIPDNFLTNVKNN